MEKRLELRQENIQAIEMWDSISASVYDNYVTLFRFYKLGKEERSDMIILNLEEAKELAKFLKENL